MDVFLATSETIPKGMGFSLFSPSHLLWLALAVLLPLGIGLRYRDKDAAGKVRWRKALAWGLAVLTAGKWVILFLGGNADAGYLPLHLCSINLFWILLHAYRPFPALDNYLYLVCFPAAWFALLFPEWTGLPPFTNALAVIEFLFHILLELYPVVLWTNGGLAIHPRHVFGAYGILLAEAVPVYLLDRLGGFNFMFLRYPPEGNNPMSWGKEHLGSHLLPALFLLILTSVVLYLADLLLRRARAARKQSLQKPR